MNSDVCICYVSAVSVFPWCLSVRIEKGGLKVKFTIGWGRSYLKYISILIEQLYKTVREIMEMLLRNCLFFVDLSKIIQSLFIRAWMSNVWSSNELWISGIIWYLFGTYFRYIWVLAPKEYVHTRPAIQPIQIPRHLLLLTVILEPVRRELRVVRELCAGTWCRAES